MNTELYGVFYSESKGTIDIRKDKVKLMTEEEWLNGESNTNDEQLINQIEGLDDAIGVVNLIKVLRPDLVINANEIE